MNRRKWLAVLGVLLLGAAAVQAGSIWAKGAAGRRAITSDETARATGDVLTVVINEHSIIANTTERKTDKSSDRTAAVKVPWGCIGKAVDSMSNDISVKAQNTFDGKGDYGSDRSVIDKITVTVEDVLPNGNMVMLGRRERVVAGDHEIVQLSGIVRPSDVNFNNEVSSDRVADFRVVYRNLGNESTQTNPGWFSQILDVISPF